MKKQVIKQEEKNKTKIAFTLFFPMMVVAAIAVGSTSNPWMALLAICTTIYEFVLVNQFIEQYERFKY